MSTRLLLFSVFAAVSAATIQTLHAQTPSDSTQQISSLRDEWVNDWNAKKLQPLLLLYAQDAVLLPATGQRITSRTSIEAYLKQVMDSSAGDLKVESVSTDESGELAYDSGSFQCTIRGGAVMGGRGGTGGRPIMGGGGSRRVEGNYLIVLKRGRDGKWLIAQHAFTEVPPAAK